MSSEIVLVNPGKNPNFSTHPPLNLGYLASYLEARGHEVRIVDELAGDDVEKKLKKYQPDMIGITGTTPVILDAYRILKLAKKIGSYVVMGGLHVSALPEEALQQGADAVVVGEGEKVFQQIVEGEKPKGIVRGEFTKNIDELPPPSFHLMDMEFYVTARDRIPGTHLRFVPPRTRVGGVITSRGCPYRCPFCYNSLRPSPLRFHSAERVMEEVKLMIDKYRVKALMFMDDEFIVNKQRFLRIYEMWKQEGLDIVWGCQARSDTIARVGLETLKLASEINCKQIVVGFESGSERTLHYLKAGTTTLDDNETAYDLCIKADIQPFGTFIIGSPGETIEDVQKTAEWIKRHPMPFGIFYLTPYPGTQVWEELKQRNKIPPTPDWSLWTTDDMPFGVCDTIPEPTLRKMFEEISMYREYFVPLPITLASKELVKHPFETMCALSRSPRKILKRLLLQVRGPPKPKEK